MRTKHAAADRFPDVTTGALIRRASLRCCASITADNATSDSAMPEPLLPIQCPRCEHDQARLYVSSRSVVTVRCPRCDHTWSIEINDLPRDTQEALNDATHD